MQESKSKKILGRSSVPKLVRWLIDAGIVKTEQAAGMMLVILIVAFFAASYYFFKSAQSTASLSAVFSN